MLRVPQSLFPQNIIALIWDFDKTLLPGYMQEPLFRKYNIDAGTFWNEVNRLPSYYKGQGIELVSEDTMYLNHILTYAQRGLFKGLNNAMLRDLGAEIKFYDGMPTFLDEIKNAIHIYALISEARNPRGTLHC